MTHGEKKSDGEGERKSGVMPSRGIYMYTVHGYNDAHGCGHKRKRSRKTNAGIEYAQRINMTQQIIFEIN